MQEIANSRQDNTKGGQCGAFVNDVLEPVVGKRVFGDSFDSKKKMVNSQTPAIGSAVVMKGSGWAEPYGHVGIVTGIDGDIITVKNSNFY